jgi:hypothetical protein
MRRAVSNAQLWVISAEFAVRSGLDCSLKLSAWLVAWRIVQEVDRHNRTLSDERRRGWVSISSRKWFGNP